MVRGRYFVKSTEEDIAALVNRMVLTGEDVDKLAQRSRAELGAVLGAKSRCAQAPMSPVTCNCAVCQLQQPPLAFLMRNCVVPGTHSETKLCLRSKPVLTSSRF